MCCACMYVCVLCVRSIGAYHLPVYVCVCVHARASVQHVVGSLLFQYYKIHLAVLFIYFDMMAVL